MYEPMTVDITTDEVVGLGRKQFNAHPRIGEWIEIDIDGIGTVFRVVMVGHSSDGHGSDLYVKRLGRTAELIQTIKGK